MTFGSPVQAPALLDDHPVARLLVPVVGEGRTERGVTLALELARAWNVPLTLLHVASPDDEGEADGPSAVVEMAATMRRRHPEVTIEGLAVVNDDVATGIDAAAADDSLVILASDNSRQWLGADSVAERLARRRSAPILMLGPQAHDGLTPGEIIVAVDGSPFAEEGITPGIALAGALASKSRVVSVIPEATVEHIEHLKAQGQRVSESAYLRSVSDRFDERARLQTNDGLTWQIIHGGDPVEELVGLAAKHKVSMLVATTHGGEGLPRQLFGSTSMGLVERSTVPVLVVKPRALSVES